MCVRIARRRKRLPATPPIATAPTGASKTRRNDRIYRGGVRGSSLRFGERVLALVGFVAAAVLAGVLVTAGVAPAIAAVGLAAGNSVAAFNGLPDYLKIRALPQTSTFYATQGGHEVPIATFYVQNRVGVAWSQVSQFVKDAAVAAEDPRFYSEGAIDLVGTIRAALSNASGSTVQGGSSITQQYVKNVRVMTCDLLPQNAGAAPAVLAAQQKAAKECYANVAGDTIKRKIQEMRYAIGIDKSYTKDQILLGYLNIAGFGGSVYGVQAASQYYFGVDAKNLNVQQAATLIAMLNNPANLRIDQAKADNPANNAGNGFARTLSLRNYVLQRMLVHHKITDAHYQTAVKTKIIASIHPVASGCMSADTVHAGFFCNYVEGILANNPVFGKTANDRTTFLTQGGLKVYTTLNLDAQNVAQNAVSTYIPPTDPKLDIGAANVDMEVGTGRVVSMVENKSFNDTAGAPPGTTSINYSTDYNQGGSAGFQTGSSFKAYDLTAWLQEGHTIYQTVHAPSSGHVFPESQFAAPCVGNFGATQWPVTNDGGEAGGSMSVLSATTNSVNTAFAQMGTQSNLCDISNAAKSLLVHSASPKSNPWEIVPPMILGTNYISPLTMATAYAGIANKGVVCTPIAIDKIIQADGTQHPVPKTQCTQAIAPAIAAGVNYALQRVMTGGTATRADPFDGTQIMGKTGTTDNSVQNWLVTSTTKVATATWVGNVTGSVSVRSQTFNNVYGGDAKLVVAKPILAYLDQLYPAPPLPGADNTVLYGKNYQPYSNSNHNRPGNRGTPTPNPSPSHGVPTNGSTGTPGPKPSHSATSKG